MYDRIKLLRKCFGLTQEEFAKRLSIKRGAVANYEVGRNIPSDSVISLICREFNVNENWLRTGEGEIFVQTNDSVIDELQKKYGLETVDIEILKLFLAMDAPERRVLTNFALRLAGVALQNPTLSSEYERVNGELPSIAASSELKPQTVDLFGQQLQTPTDREMSAKDAEKSAEAAELQRVRELVSREA